jgi:hypothetical protein
MFRHTFSLKWKNQARIVVDGISENSLQTFSDLPRRSAYTNGIENPRK